MPIYTLYDLLEKNLCDRAGQTALVLGGTQVSYGELANRAEALAAWMHERGIRRGDRVAVHLHKSIEEIIVTFAVVRIGAIIVNVSYQRSVPQLEHILHDCQVRLLFTDRRRAMLAEKAGALRAVQEVVVLGRPDGITNATGWDQLPQCGTAPASRPVDADLASLHYTSGSTGMPKGVMTTHLNLIDGTHRVADYLHNSAEDRILGLVSLSAPWGLLQVTTMFLRGGTLVLQPVAIPSEIVASINANRVTGLAAFPVSWIEIVAYLQQEPVAMPSLRYITSSGGKIPLPTLEALPRVLPGVDIYLTYGLTEAFRSTVLPPERYQDKMGSLGRPCRNVDVFIVDPAKGICGPGEQGELIHRGTLVTKGYWGDPETTARSFRTCEALRPLIGDEIVHYSGDIVRMDDEGFLWFVERADSVIKCSGYRVSPTEVEDIVQRSGLAHHAVAFGVEDDSLGQVVHVAVSAEGRDVDLAGLMQYCRQHMPTFMVPQKFHVWEGAMPIAGTGKVDRRAVIEACQRNEQ
ncbi:MAG TPA: AMP-binding protein [Candidatus Hydrogenedentes bacterium]|jgi:acyl-CoA synthetase (AMP-forming)/AMP-acid ligase II|nr:AMP-binding protein [Candidatus Hydrogenedentota bacterium]HPJ98607.1 AMP-binding protein [Candidatus Hydrogenedentota bacterium]